MEYNLACSLTWVSGMLKNAPDDDKWSSLIDEALEKDEVTDDLIHSLTHPILYCTVYNCVVSSDTVVSDTSFWPLIRSLAHHGIYLEDPRSEGCINHSMLASTDPFIEAVHYVLLKGIMHLYATVLAPIGKVVKSVRHISKLTASKELPTSVEEGLLLWINKAGRAALQRQHQLDQALLHEPDPVKRRHYRIKALQEKRIGVKGFPKATNFDSSLADGQCIAAVLLYYSRDKFSWTGFNFSSKTLSREGSLSNLNTIKTYCDTNLPLPSLHIHPIVWQQHVPTGHLKPNIVTFLAYLFHWLNNSTTAVKKEVPGIVSMTKRSLTPSLTSTPLNTKRFRCTRQTRPNPFLNLSSISVTSLPIECSNSKRTSCECTTTTTTMSDCSISCDSKRLLSVSTSSLLEAKCTFFPGAVRNSSSATQNSLLSSFSARPPAKGLITASLDTVGIKLPSVEKSIKQSLNMRPSVGVTESLDREVSTAQEINAQQGDTVLASDHHQDHQISTTDQNLTQTLDSTEVLSDPNKKCPSNKKLPLDVPISNETPWTNIPIIEENHLLPEQSLISSEKQVKEQSYEPIYLHISFNSRDQITIESSETLQTKLKDQVKQLKDMMNKERVNSCEHEKNQSVVPVNVRVSSNITRPISRESSLTIGSHERQRKEDEKRICREEQMKTKLAERDRERKNSIKERRKSQLVQQQENKEQGRAKDSTAPLATVILQPHVRTNIKLIRNAICYVCLAGVANISLKQRVLTELESSHVGHFMILFRDNTGLKFKGLYGYSAEHQYVKLFGIGPKMVTEQMLEKLFKYNCGMKSFQAVPSHTFSLSVDGFTVQDHYWTAASKRRSSHTK